jgi:hypothetical protein
MLIAYQIQVFASPAPTPSPTQYFLILYDRVKYEGECIFFRSAAVPFSTRGKMADIIAHVGATWFLGGRILKTATT